MTWSKSASCEMPENKGSPSRSVILGRLQSQHLDALAAPFEAFEHAHDLDAFVRQTKRHGARTNGSQGAPCTLPW
tara:strand:- start:333 stop:557 length:225 start_codon:yes stop_codon:yes gene_type:complete